MNWEKIYAKMKRLNLFDVQNDRCAYDFLNSLRTMNLSFMFDRKTIFNHEMNQNKFSTSIRNFLKEFRNHLRIARTLITKKATHKVFATLQEKSSNEKTTDQKKSKKFSNRRIENNKIENRFCLCDKKHLFKYCYYLIEKIRSIEWKSNDKIKKKINKILESNSKFRIAVKYAKKKVRKWLEKDKKIENFDDESTQTSKEIVLNVSFAETFVENKISYKLINCWTLNSEIDIHVFNDLKRFQLNRMINSENQLIIDKIVYDIENYKTMNIVVKKFDDSINIQLLNVALMLEFFINLICLIKMMKKKFTETSKKNDYIEKKLFFASLNQSKIIEFSRIIFRIKRLKHSKLNQKHLNLI